MKIDWLPTLMAITLVLFPSQRGHSQEAKKPDPAEAYRTLVQELEAQAPKSRENYEANFIQYMQLVKSRLQEFQKTYPKAPETIEVQFQLAQIALHVEGDTQAGVQILEGIVKGIDKDTSLQEAKAQAMFSLFQVHQGQENFTEARRWLQRIQKDFPKTPFSEKAVHALEELAVLEKLAVGKTPIPFEVKGIGGKKLSPAGYKGKVLLIDFWATWCGPCRQELPHVREVWTGYRDKGFAILGISLDREKDRAKFDQFIQREKMDWDHFMDGKWWQNEVAELYGIRSIPMTLLVDRKGKIRYKNLRGDDLKKRVAELIAEK